MESLAAGERRVAQPRVRRAGGLTMAVTVRDLAAWKAAGTRFVMLTAYDYPTARLLAEAEVPVLLVGDTLADNVLGYANTIPVTMTEMLHHARAVARGAPEQLLVGDLPVRDLPAILRRTRSSMRPSTSRPACTRSSSRAVAGSSRRSRASRSGGSR